MSVTTNSVNFSINHGGLIWRHEYLSKLGGGKFEITVFDNKNMLTLYYQPMSLADLLVVALVCIACIGFGITGNTFFPFIIAFLFGGQLILQYFNLKRVAKDMLTEILN